jgi:apoptosis-inducing factor 3
MPDAPKPDLKKGIPAGDLADGAMILGQVDGEEAILARKGNEFFAVGAACSHYHGPLADGLVVGDTVRCPWHHACFNLRTGEALRAPALDPISCWRVERSGDTVFVREKLTDAAARRPKTAGSQPSSVVIVGGGAAGLSAAEMLRRDGYAGPVAIVSDDDSEPYDRPNLSKDFLAGNAQPEWMPLRVPGYYAENKIELLLKTLATSIDTKNKRVTLSNGKSLEYGTLLLATGADPVHIPVPGASESAVHYLRTFADSRAIVSKVARAKRVVVIGASFIGLEVAASLRKRDIAVDVVAPGHQPLERALGAEIGQFVRNLHESHGVVFHLGETVTRMDGPKVTLSGGGTVDADFLVLGVGVRPSLSLAENAGLAMDRGISVNEYLETSVPGIYAAGDAARWPDPHSGNRIRIEHWVVAQQQGQVAAKNMLGQKQKFDHVPFFWSQHYDTPINYVGHAEKWDFVEIDGDVPAGNCTVRYKLGGRVIAAATIGRDAENLRIEAAMESSQVKSASQAG